MNTIDRASRRNARAAALICLICASVVTGCQPSSSTVLDVAINDAPIDATRDADASMPPADRVIGFIAHTDPTRGDLAESVTSANGTILVSLAGSHKIVALDANNQLQPFGSVPPSEPPPDAGASYISYLLAIAADAAGNVYAPVATFGAAPATGIYKIPSSGGAGSLFSTATARPMVFPNGLDVVGDRVFVADSSGAIFTVDTTSGATALWNQDPLLVGDHTACGGGQFGTIDLGANGITHDSSHVYVTVTDTGILLAIPILDDGSAGSPNVIARGCMLHGADGLALGADGNFVVAAHPTGQPAAILQVTTSGTISTLFQGEPLDFPSDVAFANLNGERVLLITNAAYLSGPTGTPGLLKLTPAP